MKPEDYAKKVADIAHVYAYRRRHHIAHTGHTVHRLLDAVSDLLGQRVTLEHKATRLDELKGYALLGTIRPHEAKELRDLLHDSQ